MSTDLGEEEDNYVEPEPWVAIQKNTFTNWVTDKLMRRNEFVEDIRTDFCNGVKLCFLVEVLQNRKIGKIIQKKEGKLNHYQASGNLAQALRALEEDNVRLVNIGAEDIAGRNLKLILGLIWTLIRKYQIGSESKLPPKKMMLYWINAVLHPHMEVSNFSTDWNDGVALHGVIEYCKPGTVPNWYQLNPNDRLGNCEEGLRLAYEELNIPKVVRAENLSSPDLDELSGMTYLSYFMQPGAPGHEATLNFVKQQISPMPVNNFDTDWNDGSVISGLVNSLGGDVPGWPDIATSSKKDACKRAMDVSEGRFGVPDVLQAVDMVNPEVDHIAVMAYAAWHQAVMPDKPAPTPTPAPPAPPPVVEERPPSPVPVPAPAPVIVPPVVGCPDLSVQAPAQWRKDALSTVRAYTGDVGEGEVTAETVSPAGLTSPVSVFKVSEDMGEHHITFTPTEKGQWKVRIFYEKSEVQHSPFYVNVYDPSQAIIIGNTPTAVPHQPYSFEVDCLQAGYSEIDVNVSHNGASVNTQLSNAGVDRTRVTFTPASAGTYRVTVFNGGVQIPGSPFEVSMSTFDVRASGDGLYNGIQGKTLSFTVDVSDNPGKKLGVTITAPSMDYVVPRIEDRGREFFVTYVPEEIGTHTVEVAYHDRQHVAGSPYSVHIREPRIYVHNMQPVAYRNQRHSFEVDASEHSSGTIEIDSDLPVLNYEKKAERVYGITYLPRRLGEHDIVLKFKDKLIEGCPFNITVYESQ